MKELQPTIGPSAAKITLPDLQIQGHVFSAVRRTMPSHGSRRSNQAGSAGQFVAVIHLDGLFWHNGSLENGFGEFPTIVGGFRFFSIRP